MAHPAAFAAGHAAVVAAVPGAARGTPPARSMPLGWPISMISRGSRVITRAKMGPSPARKDAPRHVVCKAVETKDLRDTKWSLRESFFRDANMWSSGEEEDEEVDSKALADMTIAEIGVAVVGKACRRSVKLHKSAKAKPDRESIMTLLLSLRRIRTALKKFNHVLDVPKVVKPKKLMQVGAPLRELEEINEMALAFSAVMLELDEEADIGDDEARALNELTEIIMVKEHSAMAGAIECLQRDGTIRDYLSALEKFVGDPALGKAAGAGAREHGPFLLVERMRALLQHPAWALEEEDVIFNSLSPSQERRDHPLMLHVSKCESLYDLRDKMRETCFSLELMRPMYKKQGAYGEVLDTLMRQQRALTAVHDVEVLAERLGPWIGRMPTVLNVLQGKHRELWAEWEGERAAFMAEGARDDVYDVLMRPNKKSKIKLFKPKPKKRHIDVEAMVEECLLDDEGQSECFASLVRTLEKASMDGDLVSDLDRERLSEAGYSAGELEAMFGALDVSGMGEEGEDPIPSPISSE